MSSTSASTRVVSAPVHSSRSSCSASGQLSSTATSLSLLPTSKNFAPPKAGCGMKPVIGTPCSSKMSSVGHRSPGSTPGPHIATEMRTRLGAMP